MTVEIPNLDEFPKAPLDPKEISREEYLLDAIRRGVAQVVFGSEEQRALAEGEGWQLNLSPEVSKSPEQLTEEITQVLLGLIGSQVYATEGKNNVKRNVDTLDDAMTRFHPRGILTPKRFVDEAVDSVMIAPDGKVYFNRNSDPRNVDVFDDSRCSQDLLAAISFCRVKYGLSQYQINEIMDGSSESQGKYEPMGADLLKDLLVFLQGITEYKRVQDDPAVIIDRNGGPTVADVKRWKEGTVPRPGSLESVQRLENPANKVRRGRK